MPIDLFQRFIKDKAGTIKFRPVIDGVLVVPTSATITIVDNSGNALPTPVSGAVVTVANNGEMSFAIVAANTATEGLYKASWSYIVGSDTIEHDTQYRVVKTVASQMVNFEDVIAELPRLADMEFQDTTWQIHIDTKWNFIESDLRNQGIHSFLILRSEDIYWLHLYYVIFKACLNFREADGDVWDQLSDDYFEAYKEQRNRSKRAYDSNNDSLLSEDENMTTQRSIGLIR